MHDGECMLLRRGKSNFLGNNHCLWFDQVEATHAKRLQEGMGHTTI